MKNQSQLVAHLKSEQEVLSQETNQKNENLDNEVKVQMKDMVKERQADIEMISKMVEATHKKVMNDVVKR